MPAVFCSAGAAEPCTLAFGELLGWALTGSCPAELLFPSTEEHELRCRRNTFLDVHLVDMKQKIFISLHPFCQDVSPCAGNFPS